MKTIMYKQNYTPQLNEIFSRYTRLVQHLKKQSNSSYQKNPHIIISLDVEKLFDNIQHLFMIKNLSKLRIQETFLNVIKTVYKEPTT